MQVLTRLGFAVFVQEFIQDALDAETVLVSQFAGVAAGGGGAGAAHAVGWGHVAAAATWDLARPLPAAGLHVLLQADLWARK